MGKRYRAAGITALFLKAFGTLYVLTSAYHTFALNYSFGGDNQFETILASGVLPDVFGYWLVGLVTWGVALWLDLQIDAHKTSRMSAYMLRKLLQQQGIDDFKPRSPNGMWDEDKPATVVQRPADRVRTKAVGGYDRWEPQDLVKVRFRQGSLKNKAVSLSRKD